MDKENIVETIRTIYSRLSTLKDGSLACPPEIVEEGTRLLATSFEGKKKEIIEDFNTLFTDLPRKLIDKTSAVAGTPIGNHLTLSAWAAVRTLGEHGDALITGLMNSYKSKDLDTMIKFKDNIKLEFNMTANNILAAVKEYELLVYQVTKQVEDNHEQSN